MLYAAVVLFLLVFIAGALSACGLGENLNPPSLRMSEMTATQICNALHIPLNSKHCIH
jgi:hypothetical protein